MMARLGYHAPSRELLLVFSGPGYRETEREIDSTVVMGCILGRRPAGEKAHAQYFDLGNQYAARPSWLLLHTLRFSIGALSYLI